MASKKPRKWPGDLGRSIRPRVIRPEGLPVTDPKRIAKHNAKMVRLREQEVDKEYRRKLKLLKRRYKRPELKADEVPGFKVVDPLVWIEVPFGSYVLPADIPVRIGRGDAMVGRAILNRMFAGLDVQISDDLKAGRPKKWSPAELERFFNCVRDVKKKRGLKGDREALEVIARHGEWSRPTNHRGRDWVDTLARRLREAKSFRRLVAETWRDLRRSARETKEKSAT